MKKIITSMLLFISFFSLGYAWWDDNDITAALFLAEKGVIVDRGEDYEAYNLSFTITRREMLKVMMNISGDEVSEVCEGRFSDMWQTDWGCKYAEAALGKWYIAANTLFRPNDQVTQIEALKMIMQAKSIKRDNTEDWREWYVTKALSEGIIETAFTTYDVSSLRGWIFVAAAKTYVDAPEFEYSENSSGLTPEEQELLNHFLNI